MPRSLYGRAALILILPVVTLQLGISVVFIQRHFEDVTVQMTRSVLYDVTYLADRVDAAEDRGAAQAVIRQIAPPLALQAALTSEPAPQGNLRRWYDFSGLVVQRVLQDELATLVGVQLPNDNRVQLYLTSAHGGLSVGFERQRVSASNPHQLLVWMVVLGVFMTVIAYIYLRNQLRPIKRLAAASAEYGRGRIVNYTPSGANEVRAAGHAFLDMRSRIERQGQTRTLMLTGISHDLRTPLTRLKLGLGMLPEEESAPLAQDVDDMQRLLDEFLDYARGAAEDALEEVDPMALTRQVLTDAKRAGQHVEKGDFEGEDAMVPLRPMAIRRALDNLIGNGLRYGKEVRLGVALSPRSLRFTVEDDGPGIPVAQREDAMRPFTRLDPARNQNQGPGVGLGLAIVADIARGHGGSLRLGESAALGGLKAEIVLPR